MTQIKRQAQSNAENEVNTKINEPLQVITSPSQTLFPQFLLFGDSITQAACLDFQPTLQSNYIRRLDILNRGFAGYTTTMGLETLQHFLPLTTSSPPSPSNPNSSTPQIKLMTIFFGANDACLPGFPQHVPLSEFTSNIHRIVSYPVFQRHKTNIILITTPPINEHQTLPPQQRTAKSAATYAAAVRSLASDLNLPCLDIWSVFMHLSNFDATNPDPKLKGRFPGSIDLPPNPELANLLVDGIHFTARGYEVLLAELMRVIREQIPDCDPENLPVIYREWRDILGCPKTAP